MRGCVLVLWGCFSLAMGLWYGAGVMAHDGPEAHSHKVADAEIHKPTPIPSRIVLTWEGDPATSAAVTWRTSAEIKPGIAQIAVATDGPGFTKTVPG